MTQTSPQSTERLTSRQRRIEEQRRKIEAARSQQRRKRIAWLAGIVVVVVAAIAAVVLLMPHGTAVASQMHQVQTFSGTHYPEGAAIPTNSWLRPPSSGPHWETVPQPSMYQMYDTPLPPGRWVHMLEHGAVVVLYRPDLCDNGCVQQLGTFFDNAPRSSPPGPVGIRHLTITPYQDMDHAIAVVAWGWIDEIDIGPNDQVDTDRIMADFKSKVDAPSAPERGAV
ncbi:MAG: DUF3105 domain-containing protein [Chloroflexi bacterium]|nr:DUF3105 domain-containing protein [Chloroflexota bacterium]